jgi:hypothetical protein
MVLKWIARNKYKLIALIIAGYLLLDVMMHKGLTRVLFPKDFPKDSTLVLSKPNNNMLINTGKEWVKAVNSMEIMEKLDAGTNGLECDAYFNKARNEFYVAHDNTKQSSAKLDSLLQVYQRRGLKASIWIDFKNLRDSNYVEALNGLVLLRNKYGLQNKILVESNRVNLLKPFSDSGFFTSYYAPVFNPYICGSDSLKYWVNLISQKLSSSSVTAISGYYFQYPFLKHYFPQYKILTWSSRDKWSLVNWIFKQKVRTDKAVFIALYP